MCSTRPSDARRPVSPYACSATMLQLAAGATDADGRWLALDGDATTAGGYRLVFATGAYFGGSSFHPQVVVDFEVSDPAEHHHVPLLLSAFGYTTYRGS